jgi:hypothetical protein
MSQRQQDRAVLDIIENLLKPEPIPKVSPRQRARYLHNNYVWLVILGMFATGCYFHYMVHYKIWWLVSTFGTGWAVPTIKGGVVLILAAAVLAFYKFRIDYLTRWEIHHDVGYAKDMYTLRATQRAELLQHLSSQDIARAAASGQFGAQDLENMWRKMEMDNTNSQAEKDRDLTRDTLEMQVEGDIRKLERELQSTHPSASQRSQDDRELLQSYIDRLHTIKGIKNKTVRKQAYDQFIRGKN